VVDAGANVVLLAGAEMQNLAAALPQGIAVTLKASAEDLKPVLMQALKPGDVVMVKSSKGIGLARLVDALLNRFPAQAQKRA
jgi:UDP-N-acetylmuramoyl-tripeptide--D-alanyl-D-alanine ligase